MHGWRPGPDLAGTLAMVLWHLSAATIVLALPASLLLGTPLRGQAPAEQLQSWVWALCYLGLVLSLRVVRGGRSLRELWVLFVAAPALFALGFAGVRFIALAPASRRGMLLALAISLVLAAVPELLRRWTRWVAPVLFVVAAVALARRPPAAAPPPREKILSTALQAIQVFEYSGRVSDFAVPGGALVAQDSGLLLVTGEGDFHRIDFGDPDAPPVVRRLPLRLRFGRDSLLEHGDEVFGDVGREFDIRTSDIALDTTAAPPGVYVLHGRWDPRGNCRTLRLSSTTLPEPGSDAPPTWRSLLETPCVRMDFDRRRGGFGGRLAWLRDGSLLVSLGDHGLAGADGREGAQDPASLFGKVMRLLPNGELRPYTSGHRNPQGLSVGADGSAWLTEHGPQGGDEVNLLVPGENYGWPLVTYGVQYGLDRWPLAGDRRDHGEFREPAMAFVPSVGISNLIHLDSDGMPAWKGDLLVSSLNGRALHRLRVRGDRVLYSERIPIGDRIRDLEQLRDGRIVLWTDSGTLVVLARASGRFAGAMRYAACAGCHGQQLEGTPQGPSLRGIEGRAVASQPGFPYSAALRSLGGTWTPLRLERYLIDPSGFAPGTSMRFEGMEREALFPLIEYLRLPRP